jgi:hypothetical protein
MRTLAPARLGQESSYLCSCFSRCDDLLTKSLFDHGPSRTLQLPIALQLLRYFTGHELHCYHWHAHESGSPFLAEVGRESRELTYVETAAEGDVGGGIDGYL